MSNKKPPKRTRTDYVPHISEEGAPSCHVKGCGQPGVYKAPRSKDHLNEYLWFCLDHIREHNQKWDFFADMDRDDIELFIRDAVTGHRPTWSRESRIRHTEKQLQDALYEFLHPGAKKIVKPAPPLTTKLRKALSTLDMDYPFTMQELKAQYRAMVKKHHPDVNKGTKKSEETFKQITVAYRALSEHIKSV